MKANCAALIATTPSAGEDQMNRLRSNRLA
jgi:hypothetical protein